MTRTKLSERILPGYTKGEELFNMISHIAGGALGITATVLCVVFAVTHKNTYGVVSGAIYGATLILLYSMSSIYHGLNPRLTAKKVFQILDHCSIFLLIAGSYTPLALVGIRGVDPIMGWLIFGIIWIAAVVGIVLKAIDIKKYTTFSMICYLAMGWCVIIRADLLPKFLNSSAIALLISGGLFYTIGTVFYGLGKKHRYTHSVWHLFILAGSVLHFLCILLYLM